MLKYSRGGNTEKGKLIQDEDDKKVELEKDIIMRAVKVIGGKVFWTFMFFSYLGQALWRKYADYKLKNLS
jgi:hypothetical protein